MSEIAVMGISLQERKNFSPQVQEIFSRHGQIILMRAGISDPQKEHGIITLVLQTKPLELEQMAQELKRISGVNLQYFWLQQA